MCGIAGIAYFNNKREVHLQELKCMSAKIAHRGPDDEGFYISRDRSVGLNNRRLAIIDLSKKGHQPMKYQNRFVITFNGEIYNYKELKLKLEREGYKFNSDSDTEVILALYAKYKQGCLRYLRGMFAFAIYDEIEKTLFLARDRIGKKPLKYSLNENGIVFASEIKAILTYKNIKKEIDYLSLQKYFLYGYVPAPMTGFKNINKLEPGSYIFMNLNKKTYTKKRYWQPRFNKKLQLSEKEWSEKF